MSFDFKTKLYARLERYVKVGTASDENSKSFPSTPGQLKLLKMLGDEMRRMGLKNVKTDKYGYTTAELPANTPGKIPVIGFLAHVDTSPDCKGDGVIPQLHKNYRGGTLVINKKLGMTLSAKDAPALAGCVGQDIVTASGETLLGADNKAGIAIVLTLAEWLKANPQFKHGTVKFGFTPDEEIGAGVDHFDVKKFGADYAYTLDGDLPGTIEDETFNAHAVTITVKGKSYHPGSSKNLMQNAVRIAADIVSSWPENMMPETTEKKEGFIAFMSCNSSVENATVKGIIRDHDMKRLLGYEKLLTAIVAEKKIKYPQAEIKVEYTPQYRNMKEVLDKYPQVMGHLLAAMKKQNITPEIKPIRGGTDGARLSFMGLPTPNIFIGGGNFHGKYEWVSVDEMNKSLHVLISLLEEWAVNGRK